MFTVTANAFGTTDAGTATAFAGDATDFSSAAAAAATSIPTSTAALLGNVTNLFKQLPLLTEVANQDAIGKYSLFNVSSGVRASACVCHSDES